MTKKKKPKAPEPVETNVVNLLTKKPYVISKKMKRKSIKDMSELNRFLELNNQGKIVGYSIAYLHEDDLGINDGDPVFSYMVDWGKKKEDMIKLYFWLDTIRDRLAEVFMAK